MILCQFETDRRDLVAAREHGREALAILEELIKEDPACVKYRRVMMHVSFSLGLVEETAAGDQDDPEAAREHWLEASGWFKQSLVLSEALQREGALPPHEEGHPERISESLRRSQRSATR
jgi:hypothetical protein